MTVSKNAEDTGPGGGRDIALPERLDVAICEYLSEELKAAQGGAIRLDASRVTFLGSMALQLLIAAQRQWQADGAAFHVTAPSEAFRGGLALLGYANSPFAGIGAEGMSA